MDRTTAKLATNLRSHAAVLTSAELDQVYGGLTTPAPDFVGLGGGTAFVGSNGRSLDNQGKGSVIGSQASGIVDLGNGAFTALDVGGNTSGILFP